MTSPSHDSTESQRFSVKGLRLLLFTFSETRTLVLLVLEKNIAHPHRESICNCIWEGPNFSKVDRKTWQRVANEQNTEHLSISSASTTAHQFSISIIGNTDEITEARKKKNETRLTQKSVRQGGSRGKLLQMPRGWSIMVLHTYMASWNGYEP
jgi:hypothetical protein